MTKAASSYPSVVRGVSEQVPQDRLPGQHEEQINMVSDPVRGVARRHGSVMLDEKSISIANLSPAQLGYLRQYREYSFFIKGTEYALVYQASERAHGDTLPFVFCINKDTGKFLNVVLSESAANALDPWRDGGVSALTTVGRYVVMASNSLGPGYTVNDRYAASSQQGVAWIRGGTYSRTYKIQVTRASDNVVFTATYTTMAASYPTLLDTSDIPAGASDYQKQVNDRVYAYNSAATKWLGDAQKSTQPETIAQNLLNVLVGGGFSSIDRVGGTLILQNVKAISMDDGGDGTLARAVMNEVDDPVKLSTVHWYNKVVRVKPKGTDESYYMVAQADGPGPSSSYGPVKWIEGPAQIVQPGQVFAIGTVNDAGTSFYLADSPSQLGTVLGLTVPAYAPSSVGSKDDKMGVPFFFGRRITMLTVFQDRLVIVANGTVFMSRTGDYFNWFRKSMLSVDDDDPVEAYALGAEDDIITRSVTYNKDLFMFGERKQYTISGRGQVTPKTISVAPTANERDSTYAQPVVVGNLLFYGKYEAAPNQTGPSPYSTNISQFQLGLFQDTPETYRVTQQLDRYIRGRPIELAALPSPHTVFVRTDGLDNGLYVYRFVDQPGTQARQLDSWSRWEWDINGVGRIIALSIYKATMYAVVIRNVGNGAWVGLEQFVMDSNLSTDAYLDSLRLISNYTANTGFYRQSYPTQYSNLYVAGSQGSSAAFLGAKASNFTQFYEETLEDGTKLGKVGVGYADNTYVDLTSPYVRDQNDKAIVNGRLVVGRLTLTVKDTGGFDAYLMDVTGTHKVKSFNGRRVGISNNIVGSQPVSDATIDVPVGRANTEYTMRLQARTWLPFTLSAIEWVGQFFNKARRV